MLRFSRTIVITATTTVTAAILILSAVPANAIAVPLWPAAGRVPTGCDVGVGYVASDATHWAYTYTDNTTPTITSMTYGAGASTTTVVPPAGRLVAITAKVSEPCSGVDSVNVSFAKDGGISTGGPLTQVGLDPFNATFAVGGPTFPDNAGAYRINVALVMRRYDVFSLDQDFKYLASGPSLTGTFLAGAWAAKKNYILRQTTLATSQSAAKVKKGKNVKVFGTLKYATNAGYKPDNGEKVLAQIKVGTTWVTKATLTASSTGAVTYSFAPTRTTLVRLVHVAALSGRFTAAITSAIRKVTVG